MLRWVSTSNARSVSISLSNRSMRRAGRCPSEEVDQPAADENSPGANTCSHACSRPAPSARGSGLVQRVLLFEEKGMGSQKGRRRQPVQCVESATTAMSNSPREIWYSVASRSESGPGAAKTCRRAGFPSRERRTPATRDQTSAVPRPAGWRPTRSRTHAAARRDARARPDRAHRRRRRGGLAVAGGRGGGGKQHAKSRIIRASGAGGSGYNRAFPVFSPESHEPRSRQFRRNLPDDFNVIIEIPPRRAIKYEVDKESGACSSTASCRPPCTTLQLRLHPAHPVGRRRPGRRAGDHPIR